MIKLARLLSSFFKLGGIIFALIKEMTHSIRKNKNIKKLEVTVDDVKKTKDQRELEKLTRGE